MSDLRADLVARRDNLAAEARALLTRSEGGDLVGADATSFNTITGELETLTGRIEEVTEETLRRDNAAAAVTRMTNGDAAPKVLTRDSADIAHAFRSAILAKNPAPIEVYGSFDNEWEELPEVHTRAGRTHVLTRDTLKTTATQALRVDVYSTILQHLVETSSMMRAGATVLSTDTGEDLVIPKSTAFMSSALTAEGSSITESDPTLGVVTLKAYKYASFFQISSELANDTPTNLLGFLASAAAQSLALGTTGYGTDLINGNGSGKPRGLLTDATTGVVLPTGCSTGIGTQGTVNQGTDALWSLIGSLAEPYSNQPASAFITKNSNDIVLRKLRDTIGQPVEGLAQRGQILGYPVFHDGFMPAMAADAQSIAFGDMSRYFVRIVNGMRFERSLDYAFQSDLVSFRCIIRLDGALVDTNSVKTIANSHT